eukprot:c17815_g1_i2.p1 GENE.c17815_g1_i2~~c17815_g1_i2.p1  ORF type:complete len:588 (+),score=129.40 c17815_g1_i2:926-2689(+)
MHCFAIPEHEAEVSEHVNNPVPKWLVLFAPGENLWMRLGDTNANVQLRSILNKITPETFDKLVADVLEIGITSVDTLKAMIRLLFDKAVLESQFCALYADLCVRLCDALPEFTHNNTKQNFRRTLLSECFGHFIANERSPLQRDSETSETQDVTESPSTRDSVESPDNSPYTISREEQEAIHKMRVMGNIRFMGELYRKGLVTDQVIRACFEMLMDKPSESSVDAALTLTTTVGSALAPEYLRTLFDRFANLRTTQTSFQLSSRLKFRIDDVRELWENGWQARREAITPQRLQSLRTEHTRPKPASPRPSTPTALTPQSRVSNPWKPKRLSQGSMDPKDLAALQAISPASPHTPDTKHQSNTQHALSLEDWTRRVNVLVDEFCLVQDLSEACRCVGELGSPERLYMFVRIGTVNVVESDPKSVPDWNLLLDTLWKRKVLSAEDIVKGMGDVWRRIADIEIDAPRARPLVAEVGGYLCGCGVWTVHDMLGAILQQRPNLIEDDHNAIGRLAELDQVPASVAEALTKCHEHIDLNELSDQWKASSYTLDDLNIGPEHFQDFAQRGLESLVMVKWDGDDSPVASAAAPQE